MDMGTPEGGDLAAVAPGASPQLPSDALRRLPARVSLVYAAAATMWIIGSDLVASVAEEQDLGHRALDISKGLVFVVATAVVLWATLRRLTERFDRMFLRMLTSQRDFFRTVLATSTDVIMIFDADGRILFVNDAVADVLGWAPADVVGRPGQAFVHPADRGTAVGFRERAATGATPERTFLLCHRDGSYRAAEVRGSAIGLANGETGVIANARDVTDRARSERQLLIALAEDVTGLPGLRMLVAEMGLIEELRPDGLVATIALADVDRFGDVNELHGRESGDAVLREIAGRLLSEVPEALGVWRHGADEFAVVVLADQHDGGDPQDLAERVRSVVDAPVVLDEQGARVSVELSVGAARVGIVPGSGGESLSTTLLRAAEAALGDAKAHPDRIAVRDHDAGARPAQRARLVAELHEALEHGQLVVHYQPKVRLDDLGIGGVEALVRWEHPARGLVGPDAFLGVVAEANLSAAVLGVVLDDALRRTVIWLQHPRCDPGFTVCVNVSADDLRRRRFADDVFAALERHGVEPSRLCLELTEQTMLADPAGARQVVDRLRRAGIQVAIDDFGTGYSTFEHIRIFDVDELKIDRGFVQRLGTSTADEAIVDSVLAISERLGVRVVAEGIENEAALEYLRERGCGFGQGYLLQRPVPADQIDPGRRFGPPG